MLTLKDVAEKAGVTVTTVSRVINNRGYLSKETKAKVQQAMADLNYRPNELARSLSMQSSNTIGLIVPHIVHPYFAQLISHLESFASKSNHKILLCNSKEDVAKESEYINLCKSNRVAGIVFCGTILDPTAYENLGFPLVAIECNSPVCVSSIRCDNYDGGKQATEYLIELGCKNLVHMTGLTRRNMPGDDRAKAFEDVCTKNGVCYSEFWSQDDSLYYDMDYSQFIYQILTEHPEIDGIFASSDLIAAQVIQVCAELKIQIPKQLKLIGFDDVNIASLTTPKITTVHQPLKEMAEMAIEVILKSSQNKTVPAKIFLPVKLIKRQTA